MMECAPVIVFVYCRLKHTQKTLQALNENFLVEKTDLYIFSDAAKSEAVTGSVEAVREYITAFSKNNNFKNTYIIKSECNKGLADSIIEGVSLIINQRETVIVLEDDLITSKNFLGFMNDCLEYYKDNSEIGAISGFTYPLRCLKHYKEDVFISPTGNSWGWATWKEVWNQVDWEVKYYKQWRGNRKERKKFDSIQYGIANMLDSQMEKKIDSWAVRWDFHFYVNKLYTIYPRKSLILNIGFDGSGVHCGTENILQDTVNGEIKKYNPKKVVINKRIIREMSRFNKQNILNKIINIFLI